ncbi:hypothetical protein E2C01_082513 [Portunus trituberculatus]|uniref:Uncharacterized protein n=1 Tax=Portunus trituberculatus TaxID=210409 RepID=A0A5B7IUS7_PORTR|nr:hypothetical protein [Portunus trituberculatus]
MSTVESPANHLTSPTLTTHTTSPAPHLAATPSLERLEKCEMPGVIRQTPTRPPATPQEGVRAGYHTLARPCLLRPAAITEKNWSVGTVK